MSFLLVADRPHTLPFVISIDDETAAEAVTKAADLEQSAGYTNAMFLFDLDSGKAMRMVRDGEGGWALSDTAYDQNLGVATPDDYFLNESEFNNAIAED
jgi:hypothetical protein